MSIKTIAVFLDARPSSDLRLRIAEWLAVENRASIVGIFVHLPPSMHPASGSPDSFARGEEALGRLADRLTGADASAVASFGERLAAFSRANGLAAQWRDVALEARARDVVPLCRYADLVIAPKPKPDEPADRPFGWSTAEIVLTSGVPCLIVPERATRARFDGDVVVAWNASREVRRAVSDALPLMRSARSVVVLVIGDPSPTEHGEASAHELVRFLASHGVSATARHQERSSASAGEQIVAALEVAGTCLLVAGAFGHSKVTEFVLGSTTRFVLAETAIPILLSH